MGCLFESESLIRESVLRVHSKTTPPQASPPLLDNLMKVIICQLSVAPSVCANCNLKVRWKCPTCFLKSYFWKMVKDSKLCSQHDAMRNGWGGLNQFDEFIMWNMNKGHFWPNLRRAILAWYLMDPIEGRRGHQEPPLSEIFPPFFAIAARGWGVGGGAAVWAACQPAICQSSLIVVEPASWLAKFEKVWNIWYVLELKLVKSLGFQISGNWQKAKGLKSNTESSNFGRD